MRQNKTTKWMTFSKKTLTIIATLIVASACVDNAYDLGNVNMKITLGADGVVLPMGTLKELTVDSLVRKSEIDELITEDGVYAYKLIDSINESIDAIVIDPIRDVIPKIDPYKFKLTDATLPQSVAVAGFASNVAIHLPSFNFANETLSEVDIVKNIDPGISSGTPIIPGLIIPLNLDATEEFGFTLNNIPKEVQSVDRLYFAGANEGTPMRVTFSLGALEEVLLNGVLSMKVTLPAAYTLRLKDTYGGKASVQGNVMTVTGYSVPSRGAEFVFYLAERTVNEPISATRALEIADQLRCELNYVAIPSGLIIPSGQRPSLSLSMTPLIDDAALRTNTIMPDPIENTTNIAFEIAGLDDISRVNYIAFTQSAANALTLRATPLQIPLKGSVAVKIFFPSIYEFRAGVAGLSGNVLTTTLDRLSSGGVVLPLKGVCLSGTEAEVVAGKLKISKPILSVVSPQFPSDAYKLSALKTIGSCTIGISASDMNLHIDPKDCVLAAGFTQDISIDQQIDETFAVPKEVAGIALAEVVDANTQGEAVLTISLGVENSPVENFSFDNINIVLPKFLKAKHPNLNPETNTVHIDRIPYQGKPITVARIVLEAIEDVPIEKPATGDKLAKLKGKVLLTATVNVPDDSSISGLDQVEITLRPNVVVSPLKVRHVTGSVDIDLQKYLEPTTIDLGDISESLGDQNIEINLIAPQIRFKVSNPVGIGMMGDIVMQPYDFSGNKLEKVVVKDVYVEPSLDDLPRITKLFISDLTQAPAGYTLCRVADLSKLVKIIPSKIDVTFDLKVDDSRPQTFLITGEDYPFDVDYEIKLPLKFKDDAAISYTDDADVSDTFDDIEDYDVTAEDILVTIDAKSTIPLDLAVTVDFLDDKGVVVDDVKAVVDGAIKGYDPKVDEEYKQTLLQVRVDIKDGDIQRLKRVASIRYAINGKAVGTGSGLSPEQYVTAEFKLLLKRGISIDLDTL